MRKPISEFPTEPNTHQTVQSQKMARVLNFGFRKERDCYNCLFRPYFFYTWFTDFFSKY